jgi:DNA-binding response OmpR family regulator
MPPAVWVIGGDAARLEPPVLDDDGLLRHGGRWVPISDSQIPIVELLVRNIGRLVTSAEIRRTYTQAGGSGSATSLRSAIHRLGRRVGQVGLRLHVVRGRGVILDRI